MRKHYNFVCACWPMRGKESMLHIAGIKMGESLNHVNKEEDFGISEHSVILTFDIRPKAGN